MTRAFRSPGSALKPFIYALAFENGIASPETMFEDRPTHYGAYAPENFDQTYRGSVSARRALQLSLESAGGGLARPDSARRGCWRDCARPARCVEVPAERLRPAWRSASAASASASSISRGSTPAWPGAASAPVLRESLDHVASTPVGAARRRTGRQLVRLPTSCAARRRRPMRSAGRIAFKTGTSYGYRDALAVGFQPALHGGGLARPARQCGGARPRRPAGGGARAVRYFRAPRRPARSAARASRRGAHRGRACRRHCATSAAAAGSARRMSGSPTRPTARRSTSAMPTAAVLMLKVEGGAPPFTWFVNGAPAGKASLRRQTSWRARRRRLRPDLGLRCQGTSDSVAVRLR